jgi:hypothetical protein
MDKPACPGTKVRAYICSYWLSTGSGDFNFIFGKNVRGKHWTGQIGEQGVWV